MAGRGAIVVTGASGYIGAALLPRLRAGGYMTRAVSRSSMPVPGADESVTADLRRPEAWRDVLAGVAGVIHLSSRTDLRAAEANAAADADINILPVKALIEALDGRGQPMPVVFASTVTIFGDSPPRPCGETAPDNPLSVYDWHKLDCERLLKEATAAGLLGACTLRLANVYGRARAVPGTASTNRNRGILNAMMARAIRGEALTVYGTGEYIRDFVHIDDVVAAFVAALASAPAQDGGSYVIASGEGHSLSDAFAMVAREAELLTGIAVEVRHVAEPADLHRSERRNFIGDPRLFGSRTGWRPTVDLVTGVRGCLRDLASPLAAAGGVMT